MNMMMRMMSNSN